MSDRMLFALFCFIVGALLLLRVTGPDLVKRFREIFIFRSEEAKLLRRLLKEERARKLLAGDATKPEELVVCDETTRHEGRRLHEEGARHDQEAHAHGSHR